MIFTPRLLEQLAEAAHEVWMDGKLRDGWTSAPVTNKELKQHACLIPYSQLSESDKQSDRDLVQGIPAILEKAGLKVIVSDNRPDPMQ
jgi:hypothetical protein